VFQVVADMIKIFLKEDWIPPFADRPVFVIAPALLVITTLMSFAIVPFGPNTVVADLNVGVLFFLAMSSLGSTASPWAAGLPTTNTPYWDRCAPRRRC
jgi:NADH-quinone oxidoreductase subunit H